MTDAKRFDACIEIRLWRHKVSPARWAHNPKVPGLKLGFAMRLFESAQKKIQMLSMQNCVAAEMNVNLVVNLDV